MFPANNTSLKHNFDNSLSILNSFYPNDSENSEFFFGLDQCNIPNNTKEFDFISKKKNRKSLSDDEWIEQGFEKDFTEEKEKTDEIQKENIYFIQDSTNYENIKNGIKRETDFSLISLSEEEIKEKEYKSQKSINTNSKIVKFQVKSKKARGPKKSKKIEEKLNKKIHTKNNYDNIITHVQVNFINFIINLSNDILSSEFEKDKDLRFKDICYNIKKKINFDNIESLKNSSIKRLILNPISPKFKGNNENYNEKIYNKVINSAEWLNEFFNMNFLILFKNYYFNKNYRLKQISIKGKIINLSKKTNTFYDLYEKSDDDRKKLLIKFINRAYFGIHETVEENNSKTGIFFNSKKLII